MYRRFAGSGMGVLSLALAASVCGQGQKSSADEHSPDAQARVAWRSAGGDVRNSRSNPREEGLSVGSVAKLRPKWIFATAGDVSATPTVEGRAVYVPDFDGFIYRIDNRTGKAVWSRKVSEYTGLGTSFSRNSPAIAGNLLVFGDQASATLIAVDKNTGNLVWKTLLDANAEAIITNSPLVVGNRIYVGVASNEEGAAAASAGFQLSFRGSAVAVDLRSGSIEWRFYTVPEGYTGGAVWGSTFAYDAARNSLYVTTGNNYSVPAAADACEKQSPDAQRQLACLASDDYIDAVVSLDADSGRLKWARRLHGADAWIASCLGNQGGVACPDPAGPDYDFGSGANLFTVKWQGYERDLVGAGQKSGVYWALDPDDGATVWAAMVGPGGTLGGIEWGSAVDGARVYAAITNSNSEFYLLQPQGQQQVNGGSWAALNASNGKFNWQIAVPGVNPASGKPAGGLGAVTVANGVLYAGSLSGEMDAIDAASGNILWRFESGGSVASGPSVVNGTVYWGSGYSHFGIGTGNRKLYAFSVPERGEEK